MMKAFRFFGTPSLFSGSINGLVMTSIGHSLSQSQKNSLKADNIVHLDHRSVGPSAIIKEKRSNEYSGKGSFNGKN